VRERESAGERECGGERVRERESAGERVELALLLQQCELQPSTLHCVSLSLCVVGVGCIHAVAQLTSRGNLSPLTAA
jgi:hypothetical protein